jgi:uncharacterized membrane-anchored protein YhcB (DUF1043 family)
MSKEQIVIVAEKAKSYGIALVGIVFFSLGTSYFQERLLYRVPRILEPVFDYLGNIGLAVGMLVLGGVFIAYGFINWKKVSQKSLPYWVIALAGLVVGIALANINFRSSEKIMEDINKTREAQIDEIRNSDKPDFKDQEVEKHLDEFDKLYERFAKSLKNKDESAIADCEKEYEEWTLKLTDLMPNLNNDEKVELARYNAKLSISWHDLRTKNLKE